MDSDPSLASEVRSVDRDSPSPFQTSRSSGQRPELSAADSTALLELRKLLSQSDNESSAGSSEASSASAAARHLLSEDNIFLSLRKRTSGLQDSSFSSSSAAEDPRAQPSLLWARSSSESMLLSEKRREGSVGQESLSSSGRPRNSSTQALVTAPAVDTHRRPHDGAVGRGSEPSIALSQSARRAEPEGCSAAPPDTAPPALAPPPDSSTQQPTSTPADAEEEEQTSPEGPGQSSTLEDTDQGGMSDGSSQSSLAIRVAQLLQSESPATMVSSTTSTKDHEEGRARGKTHR